jgi:hypothetical protein
MAQVIERLPSKQSPEFKSLYYKKRNTKDERILSARFMDFCDIVRMDSDKLYRYVL